MNAVWKSSESSVTFDYTNLPVYQSLTTLFRFLILSSAGGCDVARSYLDDDRAYRRRNILILVQLSMMVQRTYGKAVKISYLSITFPFGSPERSRTP